MSFLNKWFGKSDSATATLEEPPDTATTATAAPDMGLDLILESLKNEYDIENQVQAAETLGRMKNFGETNVVSELAAAAIKAARKWEAQRMTMAMMHGVRPQQIVVQPHVDATRVTVAAVQALRKLASRKDEVSQKAKQALGEVRNSVKNAEVARKIGL